MIQPPPSSPVLRHLRADVLALAAYTPGEQVNSCIKLNTNECPWPPSPAVRQALGAIVDDQLRLYPDPLSRGLRAAAAEAYGVSADQVLAGNGSDDCLTILYRSVLAPGDRVTTPWPTYGLYDTLAGIQGAELVPIDWLPGWRLPTNLPRQAAKLVIVANPNNPSGTLVPAADLRGLCDAVDGIVAVDEAYIDFAAVDQADASLLGVLDRHPNLVVLRTFSKSYSLAGARLGLLFAAAPLIAQFAKVKDSYNVNVISQALGTAALRDRATHLAQVAEVVTERRRLEGALAGFGWTWPPSAANFLLCDAGSRAGDLYRALKARGILVRWWDRPDLRNHLRITVGRPEHNDLLVSQLRDLLAAQP